MRMKKMISFTAMLTLLSLAPTMTTITLAQSPEQLPGKTSVALETVVNIPDEKFDLYLHAYLGKPMFLPITDTDLASITGTLNCNEFGIADITGAEYLVNITGFMADGNRITDLSPISNLTKLEYVSVPFNHISDITPLANLVNVTRVDIMHNHIEDISTLNGLPELTELYASMNEIVDISPLANLANLESLSLDGQEITLPAITVTDEVNTIEVVNPIINLDGTKITPEHISNQGAYNGSTITWTGITNDVAALSFTFSKPVTIGDAKATFSGTVTQPLNQPRN